MTDKTHTTKVHPSEVPFRTYNLIRDGVLLIACGIAMMNVCLIIIMVMVMVLHG